MHLFGSIKNLNMSNPNLFPFAGLNAQKSPIYYFLFKQTTKQLVSYKKIQCIWSFKKKFYTLRNPFGSIAHLNTWIFNSQLSFPFLLRTSSFRTLSKSKPWKNSLHFVCLKNCIKLIDHFIGLHRCVSLRHILFHGTKVLPFHFIPSCWVSDFLSVSSDLRWPSL